MSSSSSEEDDRPAIKEAVKKPAIESNKKLSPNWARLLAKGKQQQQHHHSRASSDSVSQRPKKRKLEQQQQEEPLVFIDNKSEMTRIMDQVVSSGGNKLESEDEELVPLGSSCRDYFIDYLDETKTKIGKYIAIDCEFVGCGPGGSRSILARVSIVNLYGSVIVDLFVKPQEKVTDWRTWVSGVSRKNMKDAVDFKQAQDCVYDILNGGDGKKRILVGHAIHNDLKALRLDHPYSLIRDTARAKFLRQQLDNARLIIDPNHNHNNSVPSLRNLSRLLLNHDIQIGQHSSIQDAQATMFVFRRYKKDFDNLYAKYNRITLPQKRNR